MMVAMFNISFLGLIIIAAAFGIFWVALIGSIASLFGSGHSTRCRRGLKFPVLFAILMGVVFVGFPSIWIGTTQSAFVERVPGEVVAEVPLGTPAATSTSQPTSDPTLEALWDKLTKSRINLGGEESEPAGDSTDEVAKDAVKDTFGLDDKGNLPPQWVTTPPKRVGQVLRESVTSDPFVSEGECRRQLEQEQLPHSVARHIGYLASAKAGHAVTIDNPLSVGIGLDFILREICRDEFTATVDTSVGEMKKVHVLLEYDPAIDEQLLEAWLRRERQSRFASVSKVAALSLTGLAAIYGLLRFDTWSKGYYSRQLLVGGTLAIISLAVLLL